MERESFTQDDFINSIERLKKIKLWGFNGYDPEHFLFWALFQNMLYNWQGRKVKAILARFLKNYSTFQLKNPEGKIIFYQSNKYHNRRDMVEIIRKFTGCDNRITVLKEKPVKQYFPQVILYTPCVFQWLISFYKAGFTGSTLVDLMCFSMDTLKLLRVLEKKKRNLCNAQAFVVLNDEYCDENIFIQFGKKYSIPTATLQHGAFSKTITGGSLAQYEHTAANFTADRILVHSQYQKHLAMGEGIPENRIIVAGIHKFINTELEQRRVSYGQFGVVLSGTIPGLDDINPNLINIANAFAEDHNYQYIIKLHPSNNEENYFSLYHDRCYNGTADKGESIIEFVKKIDFAIVGITSCFFELVYMGIPVFRLYDPGKVDIYEDLKFGRFSNIGELDAQYSRMSIYPDQYKKEMNEFKECCCGKGDVTENYRRALTDLTELNPKRPHSVFSKCDKREEE